VPIALRAGRGRTRPSSACRPAAPVDVEKRSTRISGRGARSAPVAMRGGPGRGSSCTGRRPSRAGCPSGRKRRPFRTRSKKLPRPAPRAGLLRAPRGRRGDLEDVPRRRGASRRAMLREHLGEQRSRPPRRRRSARAFRSRTRRRRGGRARELVSCGEGRARPRASRTKPHRHAVHAREAGSRAHRLVDVGHARTFDASEVLADRASTRFDRRGAFGQTIVETRPSRSIGTRQGHRAPEPRSARLVGPVSSRARGVIGRRRRGSGSQAAAR